MPEPKSVLDRIETAEKAAAAGPHWIPPKNMPAQDAVLFMLLRNYAADLLAVARAVQDQKHGGPWRWSEELRREVCANDLGNCPVCQALAPLLTRDSDA